MTQFRMWLATYNNPEVDSVDDYLKQWVSRAGAVYCTGQLERGENGTPHIQYFVQFRAQKRLGFLKKHCKKSHFTGVKFNNGADEYTNKEETRIEGPWSHGVRPARRNVRGDTAR